MTLGEAKDVGALIGAAIALLAFVRGVIEYGHQGAQKRAAHFLEMRKRLKDDLRFAEICALLEDDDPKLADIPFKERRDLLGLFEEVALLVNSGLIRVPVAHYMFGYYVIRCWESNHFWRDVNRDSIYWTLFQDFVVRMKTCETGFRFDRRHMRF